uniref:Uncharacterized protein n=1 Tax=Anopheles quadriannulatus TaxID=34691 RepID=A0A182XT61_ANOQN
MISMTLLTKNLVFPLSTSDAISACTGRLAAKRSNDRAAHRMICFAVCFFFNDASTAASGHCNALLEPLPTLQNFLLQTNTHSLVRWM